MWNPLAALPASNARGALAAYQHNQNLPPVPFDPYGYSGGSAQQQMQQTALHPIYGPTGQNLGPSGQMAQMIAPVRSTTGALADINGFNSASMAWNPNLRDRQSYLPGF